MALQFTTAAQAAATSGVKALVYGAPGVGKTTLCGTAPKPLIISCEAGLLPLRHRTDIPVLTVKTVADIEEVFVWLQTAEARANIQTVCLDSITEIAEVVLANAREQCKDPRQAYGETLVQMSDTIRGFRDLQGYHVLMLAQEELMKDDMGLAKAGPSMPGQKMGPKSPYFFDLFARLAVGQNQDGTTFRYLQVQPTPQAHAKDRSGALAAVEYPDFSSIIAKIQAAM